nr:hypothetical protein [Tanacetum cinerariifolium]
PAPKSGHCAQANGNKRVDADEAAALLRRLDKEARDAYLRAHIEKLRHHGPTQVPVPTTGATIAASPLNEAARLSRLVAPSGGPSTAA